MAKPTIALICSALMLFVAKDDGQRMLAFCFAGLSLAVLFLAKAGPGDTIAALDAQSAVRRVLWLLLLPLAWWLFQEGPAL